MINALPVVLAYGINLGIIPLLFTQVAYYQVFYPATILNGVEKGMPAFDEELFGPVASIVRAANEEQALKIAVQVADAVAEIGGRAGRPGSRRACCQPPISGRHRRCPDRATAGSSLPRP